MALSAPQGARCSSAPSTGRPRVHPPARPGVRPGRPRDIGARRDGGLTRRSMSPMPATGAAAIRRRAGGHDPHRPRRHARRSPFLDIRTRSRVATSAACSAWPSTRLPGRPAALRRLHRPTATRSCRVSELSRRPRPADPGERGRDLQRRPALCEPQRRQGRVSVRTGSSTSRWATADRAAIRRATASGSTRCWGRSSASTWTVPPPPAPTRIPPGQPVPRGPRAPDPRSGCPGCATRGASASTARRATCGSATSARRRGEIDVARRGAGGLDFGWNVMEGFHCFKPSSGCDRAGLTLPLAEYGHGLGCAVIGGVVVRDPRQVALTAATCSVTRARTTCG